MTEYLSPAETAWIFSVAFIASTVAAVTGTGGGILLLPVMVSLLGVRDAVPAYTLAQFVGNLGRVGVNWREVKIPVVAWFVVGAVPSAVIGSLLFAKSEESVLVRALGVFLLASVAWRRLRPESRQGFPVRRFAAVGAVFGFISAYLGSAGPFVAPFFLSFGLVRGAYIGTEALGTAIMHVTKMTTYQASNVFSHDAMFVGLALSPVMLAGAFTGKRILDRVSQLAFVRIVEAVLVIFGVLFLVRG